MKKKRKKTNKKKSHTREKTRHVHQERNERGRDTERKKVAVESIKMHTNARYGYTNKNTTNFK